MEAKLAGVLDAICLGSPTAIAMTKSSFLGANDLLLDERQVAMLAHEGWTQRASPEGLEGTTRLPREAQAVLVPSRSPQRVAKQPTRGPSSCQPCQTRNRPTRNRHGQPARARSWRPRRGGPRQPPGPCAMVIFGAGGDLTKRLLVPALYNLATTGLLPEHFELIGVDLADLDADRWRDSLHKMMESFVGKAASESRIDKVDEDTWKRLTGHIAYIKGDLERRRPVREAEAASRPEHPTPAATACSTWPSPTASSAPSSPISARPACSRKTGTRTARSPNTGAAW